MKRCIFVNATRRRFCAAQQPGQIQESVKPQKSSTVSVSSRVSDEPSHTWTQIYKVARASSRIVPASAVRADHTSTHQLFIVPSTAVMERVNVARRGEETVAKIHGPCKASPWLASLYLRTHSHMDITTHNLDLLHDQRGGAQPLSKKTKKQNAMPMHPFKL